MDGSLSKSYILDQKESPAISEYFQLAFAQRPENELYDLNTDPYQLVNLAADPDYQSQQGQLETLIYNWQKESSDPRLGGMWVEVDKYPYFGKRAK